MDEVINEALIRAEDMGIVFLDEIDKIAGDRGGAGPDVSREGVQRDILPIVEGLHRPYEGTGWCAPIMSSSSRPAPFTSRSPAISFRSSQGRFPIRVELKSLGEAEFVRILQEPKNALVHQYRALVETEGATLEFTTDGVEEIARIAAVLNDQMENIGARRLQTVLTTLLETVLYDLPEEGGDRELVVDRQFVTENLSAIVDDADLRRYIL